MRIIRFYKKYHKSGNKVIKIINAEKMSLKEFFDKHIEKIKQNDIQCEECGISLVGDYSEVAHIYPKSRFKSIAKDDDNIIYLCGYIQNNCHGNFDRYSNKMLRKMKIFPKVKKLAQLLLNKVTERITIKDLERYE